MRCALKWGEGILLGNGFHPTEIDHTRPARHQRGNQNGEFGIVEQFTPLAKAEGGDEEGHGEANAC